MACFTKNQQRNGTNCQFEKYVTTSNYFVLNSLDKGHLNSVCTHYVCDKSENARVCAKWQWNALDWCYWIALPASPVVQSSNTVSCVSLSFRTHPCVLAIISHMNIFLLTTNGWEGKSYGKIIDRNWKRAYLLLSGLYAFIGRWTLFDCVQNASANVQGTEAS